MLNGKLLFELDHHALQVFEFPIQDSQAVVLIVRTIAVPKIIERSIVIFELPISVD